MKITLINPPLVTQKSDFFSSGIPYFPIGMAYLASTLRQKGHDVTVIDRFGENPREVTEFKDKFLVQGISEEETITKAPAGTQVFCLYAALVTSHSMTLSLLRTLKNAFPQSKLIVFENSQQVYAYSLREVYKELLTAGADFVVMGEPEERVVKIVESIQNNRPLSLTPSPEFNGVAMKIGGEAVIVEKTTFIQNLDVLPFPAFELFPLENYWKLGYSHGPFSGKYLPILTSRGCPYGCKFCVVPSTNSRRWRVRSGKNIVDEMQYWGEKLGVTDFHWEDLNPNLNRPRMVDMCNEIIKRGMKVTWKFSAGSKGEVYDEEEIELMAKAGCVYISVSPESGSPKILKLMDKPFDHEKVVGLIRKMSSCGIATQACFVLGYPGENDEDRRMTREYLRRLTEAGLDETSLFIMTPIPGSEQSHNPDFMTGYSDFAELTFTPEWRKDFAMLQKFRVELYAKFLLWKAAYHPEKVINNIFNVLSGSRFRVKSEMTLWRVFKTHYVYPRTKKHEALSPEPTKPREQLVTISG